MAHFTHTGISELISFGSKLHDEYGASQLLTGNGATYH